jgi:biotin carboxyl carrier protein
MNLPHFVPTLVRKPRSAIHFPVLVACALAALGAVPSARAGADPAPPANADPVTQPARAVSFRPEIRAWAQVESVAPLELRMPVAARVVGVDAVPGQVVAAGTPLVRLAGPQLTGQRDSARARVDAARSELAASERSAASVARNFPALADRRALEIAQASVAAAKGRLVEAEAARRALAQQARIASPVAAVVSTVNAAPGTDLPAGAALLTLQPQGRLWLRAELFGPRPAAGGEARFVPAEGPAIPVRLAGELPARAANGARVMNFASVGTQAQWQAGDAGEVVITGETQHAVAVPAAALILDAGHWYVLADAQGKLTARPVTPGPARGADVLVQGGIEPGTAVVVRQAYLLYHRDFATRYTPPD